MRTEFEVNGRTYCHAGTPVVVVCIDGSEPGYIEAAAEAGRAPFLASMLATGTNRLADCVVPSFTNPNNLSIVTGRPPAVHGIAGNFYYDQAADAEVMMNDPSLLRVSTIFQAAQEAGLGVAIVTAKDKLRRLLGHGVKMMPGKAVCFSSEKSDQCTAEENGITDVNALVGMGVPDVYSAELSEFVFAAGVKLMGHDRPDIMYLSTTDYIQHKHAPGTPVANDFYAMMDRYLAELDAMGCVIALTADHGMNAKHDDAGQPDVIYLQDLLDAWLGQGKARVILPITDPYVVHHGALGSFATVYLPDDVDRDALIGQLSGLDGIELAVGREEGCGRFELPPDRVGDLIVVSTRHKVVGTSVARHDLSALKEPLRSHGGISEQRVPLIVNRVASIADGTHLRNFDIFDVAMNACAAVRDAA